MPRLRAQYSACWSNDHHMIGSSLPRASANISGTRFVFPLMFERLGRFSSRLKCCTAAERGRAGIPLARRADEPSVREREHKVRRAIFELFVTLLPHHTVQLAPLAFLRAYGLYRAPGLSGSSYAGVGCGWWVFLSYHRASPRK